MSALSKIEMSAFGVRCMDAKTDNHGDVGTDEPERVGSQAVVGPDIGPAIAAEGCSKSDGIEHTTRTEVAVAL